LKESLSNLSKTDLLTVASALESRRISSPFTSLQLSRIVHANHSEEVTAALQDFEKLGLSDQQILATINLLIHDRQHGMKDSRPVDLVTSGPEAEGIANRDTSVVVRELFSRAKKSVLLVGYAVYQGAEVFEALAENMDRNPDLQVKFFLNIARPDNNKTPSEILVSQFANRFKSTQWPSGSRLPLVYYDPRSLLMDKRSSLHAKSIVVDEEQVFISSANFTKAGQNRNIEVGVLIESLWLSQRLIRHFEMLLDRGLAQKAF
jgi:phosphatidylserine/phosphatidylglycerophosphate/cardiolipin synthase-like enzyme